MPSPEKYPFNPFIQIVLLDSQGNPSCCRIGNNTKNNDILETLCLPPGTQVMIATPEGQMTAKLDSYPGMIHEIKVIPNPDKHWLVLLTPVKTFQPVAYGLLSPQNGIIKK